MSKRKRRQKPGPPPALSFETGYAAGRSHGYRTGCCQSVLGTVSPPAYPVLPLRVLYIRQGFEAIDRGVEEALSALVAELHTGNPGDLYRLASELRPDLVLVMNGLHVFPENHLEMVAQVRAQGIRTAVWFADDPYFTDYTPSIAVQYDYVFTHELSCVELYRQAGNPRAHYLPMATSPAIYRPMAVENRYHSDICFIGNGFPNRIAFFNEITPFLARHKIVIIGALWERLAGYERLEENIRLAWTPVDETVKFYNGAKLVINLHRGAVDPVYSKNTRQIEGRSVNPRTYEIAACGTLQLTDVREDLALHYVPGQEIIPYASAAEFVNLADYYLRHEAERNRIAVRGLRRTILDHSFRSRLSQLLAVVFEPEQV